MTNGTVTKTMTVPTLTTNLPDVTNGTLTGSAPAPPTGGFFTIASGAAGPVTLTIHRGSATPYRSTVTTTNVLTKGSWNLDMWATRATPCPAMPVASTR